MSGTTFTWKRCSRRLATPVNSARNSAFSNSKDDPSDADMVPDSREPETNSDCHHQITANVRTDSAQERIEMRFESSQTCGSENIEDVSKLSHELRQRGVALAELGRFWQALSVWAQIPVSHVDAPVLEMMAQTQLELAEIYPALESASRAVRLAPLWAPAQQTLARALMHVGEPGLAKRSLSVALHLQPELSQLRELDLPWCCRVLAEACRRSCSEVSSRGPSDGEGMWEYDEDMVSESDEDTAATDEPRSHPILTSLGGVVSEDQSEFICAELELTGVRLSMVVPRSLTVSADE